MHIVTLQVSYFNMCKQQLFCHNKYYFARTDIFPTGLYPILLRGPCWGQKTAGYIDVSDGNECWILDRYLSPSISSKKHAEMLRAGTCAAGTGLDGLRTDKLE